MQEPGTGHNPNPEQTAIQPSGTREAHELTRYEQDSDAARLAGYLLEMPPHQRIDTIARFCTPKGDDQLFAFYAHMAPADRAAFMNIVISDLEQLQQSGRLLPNDEASVTRSLETYNTLLAELGVEQMLRRNILNEARGPQKLGDLNAFLLDLEADTPHAEQTDPPNEWYSLSVHGRAATINYLRELLASGKQHIDSLPPDQQNHLATLERNVIPRLEKSLARELNRKEEVTVDWGNRRQAIPAFVTALQHNPGSDPKLGNVQNVDALTDRAITHLAASGEIRPFTIDINRIVGTTGLEHTMLAQYLTRLLQEEAEEREIEIRVIQTSPGVLEIVTPHIADRREAEKEQLNALMHDISPLVERAQSLEKNSAERETLARQIATAIVIHEAHTLAPQDSHSTWDLFFNSDTQGMSQLAHDVTYQLNREGITPDEVYTRLKNPAHELASKHIHATEK